MVAVNKFLLSESSQGKAVKVAATATPGTTLHTGSTNTSALDEVWLYAMNNGTVDCNLTVEWGNTSSPDDLIQITLPFKSGLTLVAPGLLLAGNSSSGLLIRAFSSVADIVSIHGYVNRIL